MVCGCNLFQYTQERTLLPMWPVILIVFFLFFFLAPYRLKKECSIQTAVTCVCVCVCGFLLCARENLVAAASNKLSLLRPTLYFALFGGGGRGCCFCGQHFVLLCAREVFITFATIICYSCNQSFCFAHFVAS